MNAIVQTLNTAGRAFLGSAVPMLIQSSLLILIFLAVDAVFRKRVRAVFRYWIWMLVLVKLVLPPSLWSPVSVGTWVGETLEVPAAVLLEAPQLPPFEEQGQDALATRLSPAVANFVSPPQPMTIAPSVPEPCGPAAPGWGRITPEGGGATPLSTHPPALSLNWQGLVLLVWAGVVAALLLLLAQRTFFVQGLVAQADEASGVLLHELDRCRQRLGLRQHVLVRLSPNAASPAVCGLRRPVILIPQNLAARLHGVELQAVLFHELAHIKRGDLWINLLQTTLQILYFYNPLLWLANAVIRRIREKAVDETVLVAMGEAAPQYPDTLINVAKLALARRPALSLRLIGVVESQSALTSRIKHLLNRPLPKTARLGLLGILVIVITATVLLPMAKGSSLDRWFHRDRLVRFETDERPTGTYRQLGREDVYSQEYQVTFRQGERLLVVAELYQTGRPMQTLGHRVLPAATRSEKLAVSLRRQYGNAEKTVIRHDVRVSLGREAFHLEDVRVETPRSYADTHWGFFTGRELNDTGARPYYELENLLLFASGAQRDTRVLPFTRIWIPGYNNVTWVFDDVYFILVKMLPLSQLDHLQVGAPDLWHPEQLPDGTILPPDASKERRQAVADEYILNLKRLLMRARMPVTKLVAHKYYRLGEPLWIYVQSKGTGQWKPNLDEIYHDPDFNPCLLLIDGKEYDCRLGLGPFHGGGASLEVLGSLYVNPRDFHLPAGKHTVSYGWKDLDVVDPNDPDHPLHFTRLTTDPVEFEIVEQLPPDYYRPVYQEAWEDILRRSIETPFTDDMHKYGVAGTLLALRVNRLPFDTAFAVYVQAEGSEEQYRAGELALAAGSYPRLMGCDHGVKELNWDTVGDKRWRIILRPSVDVAKKYPPIREFYAREFVTDWLSFERSPQFEQRRQAEEQHKRGPQRYGGTIKADRPVDLDRLGKKWGGQGEAWPLPAGFELGWSPANGGTLRIDPNSGVRLLWLPEADARLVNVTAESRRRLVELPQSRTTHIVPPKGEPTLTAVRSSAGKVYFVTVAKVNETWANLHWEETQEPTGGGATAAPPDANTASSSGPQQERQIVLPEADRQMVVLDLATGELVPLPPVSPEPEKSQQTLRTLGKGDLLYDCDLGDRTLILLRDATSEQAQEDTGEPSVKGHLIGERLPEVLTIKTAEGRQYRVTILAADDKACTLRYSPVSADRGAGGGAPAEPEKAAAASSAGTDREQEIALPDVDHMPGMLDLAAVKFVPVPTSSPEEMGRAIERLGQGDLVYDSPKLILVRGANSPQAHPGPVAPFQTYDIKPPLPADLIVTTAEGRQYQITIFATSEKSCALRYSLISTDKGAGGGAFAAPDNSKGVVQRAAGTGSRDRPPSSGGTCAAAAGAGDSLSGVVVDESGRPLEGVKVSNWYPSGSMPQETRTDGRGRFSFEKKRGYVVKAERDGLAPAFCEFKDRYVQEWKDQSLRMVLTMMEGGVVAGAIRSQDGGAPLPDAQVWIELEARDMDVGQNRYVLWRANPQRTDSTGRFEFRHVPDGTLRVAADANGFVEGATEYFPFAEKGTRQIDLKLRPKTAEELRQDRLLEAAHRDLSLGGIVTDEAGRPVERVEISNYFPRGSKPQQTDTDGGGRYRFAAHRGYVIVAQKQGFAPTFHEFKDEYFAKYERPGNWRTGADRRGPIAVNLTLTRGATLTGTVLSAGEGTPAAGVRLQLERQAKDTDVGLNEYAIWKSDAVTTDGRGQFAFEHVPAGIIHIWADGVRVQQLLIEGNADRQIEIRLEAKSSGPRRPAGTATAETETQRAANSRPARPSDGTLTRLLADARAGSVILVPPGRHTTPLEVTKPVTLCGESADGCIIEVTADQPALLVNTQGQGQVILENLTIRWQLAGSEKVERPAALLVKGTNVVIRNCRFAPLGDFQRSPMAVYIDRPSKSTVDHCRFSGFDYVVCYGPGTEGTVQDCVITDCGHQGAIGYDGSTLTVQRNIITGSKFHAVRCTGGTLHVKDNLMVKNANRGIYLGNKTGQGTISNNLILGNGSGISGFGRANYVIANNVIADNSFSGIDMRDSCRFSIRNNVLVKNQRALALFKEGTENFNVVGKNAFWSNATDVQTLEKPTGSLTADPQFADPNHGDFTACGPVQEQGHGLSNPRILKDLWQRYEQLQRESSTRADAVSQSSQAPVSNQSPTNLAWQRTDRYVPPDPNGFFPDDPEAGKRLDALFQAVDKDQRSDEEILATVRQGLRRVTRYRADILGWIGNRYVWNKDPQNPLAVEILYQAVPLEQYNAVYYGLSVLRRKPPNVLRTLADICMRSRSDEVGRITWGLGPQREDLLPYLTPYLQDPDAAQRERASVLVKNFKGELDFEKWQRDKRQEQAKAQFAGRLPQFNQTLLTGDTNARYRALIGLLREGGSAVLDDSALPAMQAAAADPDRRVRNEVARLAGNRWVWAAQKQDPDAIALMVRLGADSDREVRYNAVYYGLSVVREKGEPVVRRLVELALTDHENSLYGRIVWGLRGFSKDTSGTVAKVLTEHLDRAKTDAHHAASVYGLYRDILEKEPPAEWGLAQVRRQYPEDLFVLPFSAREPVQSENTDALWSEFARDLPRGITAERLPTWDTNKRDICYARIRGKEQAETVRNTIANHPRLRAGEVRPLPLATQLYLEEKYGAGAATPQENR